MSGGLVAHGGRTHGGASTHGGTTCGGITCDSGTHESSACGGGMTQDTHGTGWW